MYVVCKLQSTDKTKTQLTIINVVRFFHKKLPLPAIRWKSFQLKGPEILYTDSQSLVVRFFCKASWSSGCRDFKRRTTSWELAGNLDIPAQIQHINHSLCKANTYDTIRIITHHHFNKLENLQIPLIFALNQYFIVFYRTSSTAIIAGQSCSVCFVEVSMRTSH